MTDPWAGPVHIRVSYYFENSKSIRRRLKQIRSRGGGGGGTAIPTASTVSVRVDRSFSLETDDGFANGVRIVCWSTVNRWS